MIMLRVLIFVCYLIILINCSEEVCVTKGPCLCEFSNGTKIDLSDADTGGFYTSSSFVKKKNGSQYELQEYFYHPCRDIYFKLNSTGPINSCVSPLSICQNLKTFIKKPTGSLFTLEQESYNYAGRTNEMDFNIYGNELIYMNGPSNTTVKLICSQNVNELHITDISDQQNVILTFYSNTACLKQVEKINRSLGSTVLIIMFTLVMFYLVLGVLTKKYLMGATGVEVIPNLNFWMDLPYLVKDGWYFVINKLRISRNRTEATNSDPNSYDNL